MALCSSSNALSLGSGSALQLRRWCPHGLSLAALTLLLAVICLCPGGTSGNKLRLMLQKREDAVPSKHEVLVSENRANAFLNSPKRHKRQLWDRSQPDVQQWYQQFIYMGFDETKFEDDSSYWRNMGRGGSDYYGGYHQHHYDEDAAIGPRDTATLRHGAGVNYDDY